MNVRQVVPKDAIPSIDDPTFAPEYVGSGTDDALVVDGKPPRAYPFRILDYHEIVNDRLPAGESEDGTDPIAVTWCPLCASAVVYDRRVDGRALTFDVSGKLADDDLVMYDRETGSEWKRSTGTCIAGPLEGERLTVRPAAVLSVETFRDRHPDGVTLQPVEGAESEAASSDEEPALIDYGRRPYADYFSSDALGLAGHRGTDGDRSWDRPDLDPKTIVCGIERGGDAVGFPLPSVERTGGWLEATVGDAPVVVFATDGGVHAFERPSAEFSFATRDSLFVADDATWDGVTGRAEDGRRLERLPARRSFAFAWADDHGTDAFYDGFE